MAEYYDFADDNLIAFSVKGKGNCIAPRKMDSLIL